MAVVRPFAEGDLGDEPGSIQTTSPRRTRGIFGSSRNGGSARSSGFISASRRRISRSSNPVPTLPAYRSLPAVVDREDERAERGRAGTGAARVPGDHELLAPGHLELEPVPGAAPLGVARGEPFGDNALEPLCGHGVEERLRRLRTARTRARSVSGRGSSSASRALRASSGRSTSALAVGLEHVERIEDRWAPSPAASPRSSGGPPRRARRPRRR